MKEILFYMMIYFIIGGILSSLNYFYYVIKNKDSYVENPGEPEIIIFLCFPLYLASIFLSYWFSFIKWLALKIKK